MIFQKRSKNARLEASWSRTRIEYGEIATYRVDAVVNEANETFFGASSGLQPLARTGGAPELHNAGSHPTGCEVGEVQVAPAMLLPARYVMHTVGPEWSRGQEDDNRMLESCYRNALVQAVSLGLESIAFSAISCGPFGFPVDLAAKIAMATVFSFLENDESLRMVIFVCRRDDVYEALDGARRTLVGNPALAQGASPRL